MSREARKQAVCDVCGSANASLVKWKDVATLCPLHAKVVAGILPKPQSVKEIRALFPARVVAPARKGDAA